MQGGRYIFLLAAIVLLAAGIASILSGKTLGLYGAVQNRSSVFYWILVATCLSLGLMCLVAAVRGRRR